MRVDERYPKSVTPFEELLYQAKMQADDDWSEKFVSDLQKRFDQYGGSMYLSDSQHSKLVQIANGE